MTERSAACEHASVAFTVYGVAQPAGSKRAFVNKRTKRVQVTDANAKAKPWQAEVRAAAWAAMHAQAVTEAGILPDGPLSLTVVVYVPRPKGHYGKHGLLPSAPIYPTVRPDVTKLVRGIEDALTGVVWRDDAQVVDQSARKRYGEPARAEVTVEAISPPPP